MRGAEGERQVRTLLARIPAAFSADFKTATASMLRLDPAARPSASDLLKQPLFLPHASILAHELDRSDAAQPGSPLPTGSMIGLQSFVDRAAWMAPLRVSGLQWEQQ